MNISAKTRDMPVSYQDFVLYSQATGAPLPRNAQERMQMAPEVYTFTRQIGGRPSGIRQGLSAVGRGLAVLGGAGVAVGVANSLFNKPSDNYRQAVTNNQTTVGKEARKATQTTFDDSYTTGGENYTGQGPDEGSAPVSKSVAPSITTQTDQYLAGIGPNPTEYNQYDATIGPHSLASATGIGRKPRMARLGGSEFSQALRYGDQAANLAAAKADNTPEYQISDKDAADIAAAENMPASPTVQADETARKMRQQQHIENSQMLPYDSPLRATFGGKTNPPEETTLMDMMSDDTPLTDKIVSFVNKTKKNLPEKKTPEISDIGQRRDDNALVSMKTLIAAGEEEDKQAILQTPDVDLSEIENDPALKEIGMREEPKDRSPRGVIPPDRSGTMKKTDLGAIGDIISEKQSDNPIVGGLQAIGKVARTADKLGRRAVEEIADKGQEDRRKFAKYKETIRKAKAFKDIADERESTKDPE